MAQHFSTGVIPAAVISQPVSTPLLVLGADSEEGVAALPMPTALHLASVNEVVAFTHTTPVAGPLPVSDLWVTACSEYGDEETGEAKVALVLEPVPADIATTWASTGEGVSPADMPPWITRLIMGGMRCALRDVRVTMGSILDLNVLPYPGSLQDWADAIT